MIVLKMAHFKAFRTRTSKTPAVCPETVPGWRRNDNCDLDAHDSVRCCNVNSHAAVMQ